jgi:hypothetical protein
MELNKPWYSPNTEWPDVDLKIVQLPDYYAFDLEPVLNEVHQVLATHGTYYRPGKYENANYSGLSLTAREENDAPLADWHVRVNDKGLIDVDHSIKLYKNDWLPDIVETPYKIETEAMLPAIKLLTAKFKSKITKVCLMKLEAGGAIVPHVDFPYYETIRLHASIFTNDQMHYDVEGQRFSIPANGKFYLLNAGKQHGVINEGSTDRLNLNINLKLDSDMLRSIGLQAMITQCLL